MIQTIMYYENECMIVWQYDLCIIIILNTSIQSFIHTSNLQPILFLI